MKWFLRIAGVILGLIVIMFIMGSTLPEQHTAKVTATFSSTPEAVWRVLNDFSTWPSWRSDLKEVRRTGDQRFTEINSDGDEVEYGVEESVPAQHMVTRIITPDLPYGGSWIYELSPAEGGCKLTITEKGEVYNPMFRFMSNYMFGHNATMETFLSDLRKKIQ